VERGRSAGAQGCTCVRYHVTTPKIWPFLTVGSHHMSWEKSSLRDNKKNRERGNQRSRD
jgi:hypothetical protein